MALCLANFSNTKNATSLNGTAPTSQLPPEDDGNSPLKWLRVAAYCIICLCGVSGNLMVILAVRRPGMGTVSNVLIANLAVADLTVSLINVPTVLVYGHLVVWPFGSFLCKILPFIQGVTLSASIGTLIAIASERYWHIVLYRRRKLTVGEAFKFIGCIWASSTIIPLPMAVFSKTIKQQQGGETRTYCIESWPSTGSRQAYTAVVFLLLYFLPLILVSLLYVLISRFLRGMPETQRVTSRYQKKVIRMMVVVVVLFGVCWLPYHTVYLFVDFAHPKMTQAFVSFILFVQWLMFANSTCNPVVYAVLNHNYRRELTRMMCGRRQPRRRNGVSIRIQAVESVV